MGKPGEPIDRITLRELAIATASAWGKPGGSDEQHPMKAVEAWLLHHVAHAVEAGEVSADLLAELRAEMESAKELPQAEGHALAVQDIAERLGLPVDHAEKMLAALEAQPAVTRELLLPEITPLAVPPRPLHRLSGVRE